MRKRKSRGFAPSRESVLSAFKTAKCPLDLSDLAVMFEAQKQDGKIIKRLVSELAREGAIVRLKDNRYGVAQEMNLRTGTLSCTSGGNGFVITGNIAEKDIFVPSFGMLGALHGDKVVVRIEHTSRGRKEGKVIQVLERKSKNVTGYIRKQGSLYFLVPDDDKIGHHFLVDRLPRNRSLREGDLAAAKILLYPGKNVEPLCRILKTFRGLDQTSDINRFVEYKHSLPGRFTKKTQEEAGKIANGASPAGRKDLRSLTHVTIDGKEAKDFDDAVAISKTSEGYRLFVSIADVSSYVPTRSLIDQEAYERGTSIYFPGSVIPMLPERLSNDLCSLRPEEDRYTMTAIMEFDRRGNLRNASFSPSLIRSAQRLTYQQVEAAVVHNDPEAARSLQAVLPELQLMAELASIIRQTREKRGSLDFDLPEPDVILDLKGGIETIIRSERLFAHTIIEEFMIAANEAVATYLEEHDTPVIYRIHEPPDPEKLRDFERIFQSLPIGKEKKRGTTSRYLQAILHNARDTEYEYFVNRILLRSMKQAKYAAVNKGHFGLASPCYLHFTSPIRRYPDLVCHRVLNAVLRDGGGPYSHEELEKTAIHLSSRERLAMEAERELEDRLRVLFMKDKIGEVFGGIISHITSFGMFVELYDYFVEGLILLTELPDDYYIFQEDRFRLLGRRTKKTYRVGDTVKVKVVHADVERNRLHFVLAP